MTLSESYSSCQSGWDDDSRPSSSCSWYTVPEESHDDRDSFSGHHDPLSDTSSRVSSIVSGPNGPPSDASCYDSNDGSEAPSSPGNAPCYDAPSNASRYYTASQASGTDSVCVSNTSTYVWDQEPWETFSHRILDYAIPTQLPLVDAEKRIELDRIRGGSFNRVAGLTVLHEFIMRWPRWEEHDRVSSENAILAFVKQNTNIPVARVIAFDDTQNNRFESPYSIHQRLPGVGIHQVYNQLSHELKVKLAGEVGRIFAELRQVKPGLPGRVNFDRRDSSVEGGQRLGAFGFEPFYWLDAGDTVNRQELQYLDDPASVGKSFSDSLIHIFEARRARVTDIEYEVSLNPHILEGCTQMARDLQAQGYFDGPLCLNHGDLHAHNILINPQTGCITGVLDWDFSSLVPRRLVDPAPFWLWSEPGEDVNDWKLASKTPATPQDREIKSAFEEVVEPEYLADVADPKCRLAKQLFATAMEFGPQFKWYQDFHNRAVEMLTEWTSLGGSNVKYWERVEDDLVGIYCSEHVKALCRPLGEECCI